MRLKIILFAILLGPARSALAAQPVDYLRDVKPILAGRCSSCHGAIRQKAGLRLDTAELVRRGGESGPSVEPGKSGESLLVERVTAADDSERMPPPREGVRLGEEELNVLRAWIDQGAVAPPETVPEDPRRHWAYRAPTRPAVPRPADPAWSRNPIDAFLAAAHQEQGLRANPPVTRDLWLRRVTLDLVGLPPTREGLAAFRADEAPEASERVVDRLLASPQYGERWGRHWMDVWRYSDWYGLGDEVRFSHPHIWNWRDWIVEALNADKGYDRMVVEMLAGDEVAPDDPATLRATGFLVRNWDIFSRNTWLGNTVEHTARAFLGVTIQCAKCHDHKFDPVSQVDYYRLRAFFEPSHIRIDRVPGQPDRAKGGLPRIFDDFVETPTYLFVRGDEGHPDKSKPLTPATPAVLGGEVQVAPVPLPVAATCPDKREFVIRETVEAGERAIAQARIAVDSARKAVAQKTQALAALVEDDRQAQGRFEAASGKPEEQKKAREAAAGVAGKLARARQEVVDASEDLRQAESALPLAETRQSALVAVLRVERLADDGAKDVAPTSRTESALQASAAQKRQAVLEAEHDRLAARRALDRVQRVLDGLTAASVDPKDKTLQGALGKASAELVEARGRLAAIDARLEKAEAASREAPTTTFTPRALTFHRAKTTYREEVSNAPYSKVSTGRRLALARWITDRRNPLAARVAVNHIWARHFGEPLVASLFDFGLRTERPVHHELLDWLAVEFMESGWSMKHLHRLIVTSEAYRMQTTDGEGDAPNAKIDPDNHFLWRMNVRRMEAEVIRDSLLHLAGRLDLRMGGADLPVASAETETRRSIYYRYTRDDRIPFLTMFDAPSVEECYRRPETIVPQQALALTNSGIALARAGEIASAIDKEVGEADLPEARAAFVVSAFERMLGRSPTDAERAECARALEQLGGVHASEKKPGPAPHLKARAALVHVLINHNDFVSIR